jgi:hypothetical protein
MMLSYTIVRSLYSGHLFIINGYFRIAIVTVNFVTLNSVKNQNVLLSVIACVGAERCLLSKAQCRGGVLAVVLHILMLNLHGTWSVA